MITPIEWIQVVQVPIAGALLMTLLLALKSLRDFSQTGPRIKEEILKEYYWFSFRSFTRLCLWSFLLFSWMAMFGSMIYLSFSIGYRSSYETVPAIFSSLSGVLIIVGFQFCRHLLQIPCSIMMSSHYSMKRLIPLWNLLGHSKIRWFGVALTVIVTYSWYLAFGQLIADGALRDVLFYISLWTVLCLPVIWVYWPVLPAKVRTDAVSRKDEKVHPNVLMIGCDTLRSDRLGHNYRRNISPFLNWLCTRGTFFSNCHTPIARTAPSLASIFTGTWPSRHGVRTNFATPTNSPLTQKPLARCFSESGYETAAISDWSGSDLGKFDFGFQNKDLPPDQWNLKYLIRQGPKHLRLFLTLFTHNRFGKMFLPELYYLAGIPLTADKGAAARKYLSERARDGKPFFLNLFVGTTHPPFGTEYPYYTRYTEPDYQGESKFGMARLTDPNDIIQSQKEPRSAFDLEQIIDLYDGSVHNFDDEVRKICHHLESCGLGNNTIIVIYSDHGMEFFEQDTWGQGNHVLGTASSNIPFIICDPRTEGRGELDLLCRSIDIMPTIAELCGIETPDTVQGSSLVAALKGDEVHAESAYFETGLWLAPPPGQHTDHLKYPELIELLEIPEKMIGTLSIKQEFTDVIEKARDRRVKKDQWLLVRLATKNRPIFLLFDTDNDPLCVKDVSENNPDIVQELLPLILRHT